MDTPLFQFQINKDGTANVFVNGAEKHNVTEVNINGIPRDFDIEISQFERDEDGNVIQEELGLVSVVKRYHFGD